MGLRKRLVTRRFSRSVLRGAAESAAVRPHTPRAATPPPGPPVTIIHRYDYLSTAALTCEPLPLPVPHMYSS